MGSSILFIGGGTLGYPLYSTGDYPYSVPCDLWGATPTTEQMVKDNIDLHISAVDQGCSTAYHLFDLGHRIKKMEVGQQVYHKEIDGALPDSNSLNRWIAYFTYEAGTGYNGYTYYVAFVDSNGILQTAYKYPTN